MSTVARVTGLTITDPHGRHILDRVDLELPAGTVTGLVGESGSGKTSLAHALLGNLGEGLRCSAGSVRVDGLDPFTLAAQRTLRGRVTAYLPQDPASALDPAHTVAGQLRVATRLADPTASRTERADRVRAAADAASLDPHLLGRYPAQLSGGQAQRALLAWTLLVRPRLLLLDEPTSGLDDDIAARVGAAFTRLPWNPAVLLISHDRALIDRAASRTFHLSRGRLCDLSRTTPAPGRHSSSTARPPRSSAHPLDAPLSMTGVTIRRGGRVLLQDAQLCLDAGELLAIRGPSGTGKTSLARALCGFAPPTAGILRTRGRDISWQAATRSRTGDPFIAYVGQDARAALNPQERIRRTLQRAIDTGRRHARAVPANAADALALVGLDPQLLHRTPDLLSGGQRHRVALARALAAGPTVLICDETTAALDHGSAQLILDTLDELRRGSGLPVLLITHQDSVADRADRILTLREGRLE